MIYIKCYTQYYPLLKISPSAYNIALPLTPCLNYHSLLTQIYNVTPCIMERQLLIKPDIFWHVNYERYEHKPVCDTYNVGSMNVVLAF